MPLFEYTARDGQGELINETIAFPDEIALRHHLRKNELYLVSIAERKVNRMGSGFGRGIGLRDLIIMTRQLRTMIKAGMPLVSGLDALREQSANRKLALILTEIARSVGSGLKLADSMEEFPKIFPMLLCTLVRSGEEGGRLPEALEEASRQMELQMDTRQKIITAMIYPCFTVLVTIGVLAAMLIWIVPTFAAIYKDLNATLPAITLTLVWMSNVVIDRGWIVALIVIACTISLKKFYKTPEGRLKIDGFKLRMPLMGTLFIKSASANLTGSLAGLLSSGLPLLQALNTAANVCGNEVVAQAVRKAGNNVTLGRRLSDELEQSNQFPMMVTRMIAMAEEIGTLPDVLKEISLSYIEDVEYAIKRITSIIEPIMVLCVGGVVGFILVALYYPIFNLGNAFLGDKK